MTPADRLRRQRGGVVSLVVAASVLAVSGCATETAPERAEPLRVFVASSLTEVVETLAARSAVPISPSYGGSSALARQIRDGAPADVFLSASPRWVDFLRAAGALSGAPIVLARNRLVAIAPENSPLVAVGITDARALLGHLGGDARLAIGDEGVPAGEYARAALAHEGLLGAFRPHLVGQRDVRAVLHAVAQGEQQAGFVYATDARIAAVTVLFAFDPTSHPPIEYQAATLTGAAHPDAARDFLDDLQSDTARAVLAGAGFELPGAPLV